MFCEYNVVCITHLAHDSYRNEGKRGHGLPLSHLNPYLRIRNVQTLKYVFELNHESREI